MDQATAFVWRLIVALLGLVMGIIAGVEDALRTAMSHGGVDRQFQSLVLIVVPVLLIIAALRVLGRVFGLLIAVFLVLLLLHVVTPGMHAWVGGYG